MGIIMHTVHQCHLIFLWNLNLTPWTSTHVLLATAFLCVTKLWQMLKQRLGENLLDLVFHVPRVSCVLLLNKNQIRAFFLSSRIEIWNISQRYEGLLKLQRDVADAQKAYFDAEGDRLKAEAEALSTDEGQPVEGWLQAQKLESQALGQWWVRWTFQCHCYIYENPTSGSNQSLVLSHSL